MITKILFTALIILNIYLFTNINDDARSQIISLAQSIPDEVSNTVDDIGIIAAKYGR